MSPDNKTGVPSIPPPLNIPPSRARRQLAARLAAKKEANAAENAADPDAADSAALEAAGMMDEEPGEMSMAEERGMLESGGGGEGLNITGLRTVSGLGATASRFSGLFSGSDDDSSDSGDEGGGGDGYGGGYGAYDEDDAGRDVTVGREGGDFEVDEAEGMSPAGHGAAGNAAARRRAERERKGRRPSTTEAKERVALMSDDEDEVVGGMGKMVLGEGKAEGGPFADPEDMEGVDTRVEGDSSDEEQLVEIKPRRTS